MRSFDTVDSTRTDEGVRYPGSRDPPSTYQEDPPDAPSLSMSMASPVNSMLSINTEEKSLIGRILQEDFARVKPKMIASVAAFPKRKSSRRKKETKSESSEEAHGREEVEKRHQEDTERESPSTGKKTGREKTSPTTGEAQIEPKQEDTHERAIHTTISKLTERSTRRRERQRESKKGTKSEEASHLVEDASPTAIVPLGQEAHMETSQAPSKRSSRSSSRRPKQTKKAASEHSHSLDHSPDRLLERPEVDVEKGFATNSGTSPLIIKMRIDAEEGSPFVRYPSFFGAIGLTFTTTYALIFDANGWTIVSIVFALAIYAICLIALILEGRFLTPNPLGIRAHLRSALARKNKLFRFVWGRGVLYVLAGSLSCGLLLTPSLASGFFFIGVGVLAVLNGSYAASKYYSLRSSLRDDVYLFRMFNQFDSDQDGYIDLPQFVNLVGSLGMDLDDRFGIKAFNAADVHKEYKLSYPEFCTWWKGSSANGDKRFQSNEYEEDGDSYMLID